MVYFYQLLMEHWRLLKLKGQILTGSCKIAMKSGALQKVVCIGKVLDLFFGECGIDSCPVGLWSSHGGYNQKWRRSGDKIVAALPGYLAQDNSGNLVGISSTSDDNRDWIKLEIGNMKELVEAKTLQQK